MHSTRDNTEIMINDEVDDVIKWLFESLPSRYQISLGRKVKGSGFVFHCVNLLCYRNHKIIHNVVDHIQILLIG